VQKVGPVALFRSFDSVAGISKAALFLRLQKELLNCPLSNLYGDYSNISRILSEFSLMRECGKAVHAREHLVDKSFSEKEGNRTH